MKKYKFLWVISATCIILSIFYSFVDASQTNTPRVKLTTNPPLEKILPFRAQSKQQKPVTLTLQALDASSQPLKGAKIGLEILTPSKTPWFSTDFPIVEATKLLKLETIALDGKLEIQQMLPIRGKYQLKASVAPSVENTFASYQEILTLNVSENPVKFKYFGVVAAILLGLGLLGGLVIGGQQQTQEGEIAPYNVRLLLSGLIVVAIAALLFINISAEVADAHGNEEHSVKILPAVQKTQGLEVRLQGDKQATVGKLASYTVQAIDTATQQPVKDVAFQVKAIDLEDNLPMFSYKAISDTNGQLTWQEQFFDGAPHKIEVEVTPANASSRQFQPLKVEKEVEVEGIAPPLYTRFISLFYFTSIVGIGMAIGLWLQHKRIQKAV
ncbi:hypothetical protein NIES2101_19805 [Calothrix sp. HK-06]|nr:hypothetical protein NIES2101_19805 [Calothrix sp. HK-06]